MRMQMCIELKTIPVFLETGTLLKLHHSRIILMKEVERINVRL